MTFAERLVKQMINEYKSQDRSGVYALTQRKMAYNSNKIEGSTLSEKQTASIFETGSLSGEGTEFRTKDVEEMTGHFTMFNYMLQTYQLPLSEDLVKQYHFKLKAGVFEDIANGYPIGDYKNRRNIVSDIMTALPSEVPEKMNDLIAFYEKKNMVSLEDIARFHADFEKIHPFQDGNGRVGRILVFKECLRQSFLPVLIFDDTKKDYYQALHHAQQEEDYDELIVYFRQNQDRYRNMVEDFLIPETGKSLSEIIAETNKKAMERDRRILN
ncbi:MAG: Fic family protein [Lachnospiraceae bacterium]|nr:Fic family protein [Lachnospiraceae bacterium]